MAVGSLDVTWKNAFFSSSLASNLRKVRVLSVRCSVSLSPDGSALGLFKTHYFFFFFLFVFSNSVSTCFWVLDAFDDVGVLGFVVHVAFDLIRLLYLGFSVSDDLPLLQNWMKGRPGCLLSYWWGWRGFIETWGCEKTKKNSAQPHSIIVAPWSLAL